MRNDQEMDVLIAHCRSRLIKLTTSLLCAVLLCASASAQTEQLRDLAGRLEYGFYAADTRALQQDLQTLMTLEAEASDARLRDQHLGYARWKLSELLMRSDPVRAAELAEVCANVRPDLADVQVALQHAVRAACAAMLEKLRPVRGVLYRREREAALLQARKLGSKLPQVQLVESWVKVTNGEAVSAVTLRSLVAAYDAASISELATATLWGHAEACYLLGQAEMQREDLLAARNALERAVLLAPDYQAAQLLLRNLSVK